MWHEDQCISHSTIVFHHGDLWWVTWDLLYENGRYSCVQSNGDMCWGSSSFGFMDMESRGEIRRGENGMIVWLNVGSLLLGLLAWTLPLVNLVRYRENVAALAILSMGACAISLSFQIFYHYHLVKIGDWSAIMDITGTMAFASAMLITGTILLNAVTLIRHKKGVAA